MPTNTDKEIRQKIHSVIMNNLTKIIPTILLMYFITFVSQTLILFGILNTSSVLITFASLVAVQFILIFFYYGLSVLLGKFYTNNRPIIGDLFAGKNEIKRLLLISIRLSLITIVTIIIVSIPFISYVLSNMSIPDVTEITTATEMALVDDFYNSINNKAIIYGIVALSFLILGLFILQHSFIFPVITENPKITLREALTMSRKLLKGNVFKFLWLCIKTTIIPVLIWVLTIGATFFVNNDFVLPILDLISTVALYYSVICVLLASNAYFIKLSVPQFKQIGFDVPTIDDKTNTEQSENEQISTEQTTDDQNGDDLCSSSTDTLPQV